MQKLSGKDRRLKILEKLSSSEKAITGSALAKEFGVSRQVIVTDIALIKATKPELISTSSGYKLMEAQRNVRIFKVRHSNEETADELQTIIDLGGNVIDVFVEHKIYGTIRAPLNIQCKRDIENFMADLRSGVSTPLMSITQGYHFHTIEARSEAILDDIEDSLKKKGFLIQSQKKSVVWEAKSYGIALPK